jgi:hypothetical protein
MIDKTPNRPAERTTRRQLEVVTIPIQASIDQVARWAALEYTRDLAGRPKLEPHVVVSGQVDADEVAHIAELAVADDEVAVLFAVYSQLCCMQLLVKETRKRGFSKLTHSPSNSGNHDLAMVLGFPAPLYNPGEVRVLDFSLVPVAHAVRVHDVPAALEIAEFPRRITVLADAVVHVVVEVIAGQVAHIDGGAADPDFGGRVTVVVEGVPVVVRAGSDVDVAQGGDVAGGEGGHVTAGEGQGTEGRAQEQQNAKEELHAELSPSCCQEIWVSSGVEEMRRKKGEDLYMGRGPWWMGLVDN